MGETPPLELPEWDEEEPERIERVYDVSGLLAEAPVYGDGARRLFSESGGLDSFFPGTSAKVRRDWRHALHMIIVLMLADLEFELVGDREVRIRAPETVHVGIGIWHTAICEGHALLVPQR